MTQALTEKDVRKKDGLWKSGIPLATPEDRRKAKENKRIRKLFSSRP